MTTTTFTDAVDDTLKVRNWTGVPGHGDIYITETTSKESYSFNLTPDLSLDIAKALVAPLDATIMEGPLPNATVVGAGPARRVVVGAVSSKVTEGDAAFMETRARRYLAASLAIRRLLADDNRRAAEQAEAELKLKERKDALAKEFSKGVYHRYVELGMAARRAIDAVITLEDR